MHILWSRLFPAFFVLLGLGLGYQYQRQRVTEGLAVAIIVVLGVLATALQWWLGI